MKNFALLMVIMAFIASCKTTNKLPSQNDSSTATEQDTVRIANDELEYEILIIEPGFNTWLIGMAKPEGYYSQEFLESRNPEEDKNLNAHEKQFYLDAKTSIDTTVEDIEKLLDDLMVMEEHVNDPVNF